MMTISEETDDTSEGIPCEKPATKSYSIEMYDRPGAILTLRVCEDCYRLLRSSRR